MGLQKVFNIKDLGPLGLNSDGSPSLLHGDQTYERQIPNLAK